MPGTPSGKLEALITEFREMEPRDRLERLLDFSDDLPELPDELKKERDAGQHRIHECQTPVFLWVMVEDGRVRVYADVPESSPTVRGFVSLLADAFSGATPDEVLSAPLDVLQKLGLLQALGMVRMQGLNAIVRRIRDEVSRARG